jgi:hypothetical protein
MAYAFDKVDDYFRRNKQGTQGSLQRGNMGAPPPTAAAEQVAKQAETSAEMGNADTSAFRANQGASQAAAQSALTQPAQRQAQAWEAGEQQKAGQYKAEGEKKIGETYKAWNPESIAGIEAGNQDAMNTARQQVGYTGKEMTFQPYQASTPQLDTTSMLRGGVGGLQAALQKGKGGRYTAGMGALDASLMAGNRGAMQGLQNQLGDVYQGARQKKAEIEQTDEQLAQKALETGTGVSQSVKSALQARMPELQAAQAQAALDEANRYAYNTRGGVEQQAADAYRQTLSAGLTPEQVAALYSGEAAQLINQYNPQEGFSLVGDDYGRARSDFGGMIKQGSGTAQFTGTQIDPRYANLAGVLGVAPQASTVDYNPYEVDYGAVSQSANALSNLYKSALSRKAAKDQSAAISAQEAQPEDKAWDQQVSEFFGELF